MIELHSMQSIWSVEYESGNDQERARRGASSDPSESSPSWPYIASRDVRDIGCCRETRRSGEVRRLACRYWAQGEIDWLNRQPLETLYLASMTAGELRAGVALMPAGKRRKTLGGSVEHLVLPGGAGRVLAFEMACMRADADVLAAARKAGSGIEAADAVIAAFVLTK